MKFATAPLIAAAVALFATEAAAGAVQHIFQSAIQSAAAGAQSVGKQVAHAAETVVDAVKPLVMPPPVVRTADLSWKSCGSPEDTLRIDSVVYEPLVPVRGQPLNVTFKGELYEPVEAGSMVNLNVKWGFIRVPVPPVDICKSLADLPNNEHKCPLPKGPVDVKESFILPEEIPDGKFDVNIRLRDSNKRQIACIQAKLTL